MSDNNNDNKLSSDEEIQILIRFINETLHENKKEGTTINTVSTLWIILFVLIIVQKAFKYIIKPIHNYKNNNDDNANQPRRDPSAECIIV